MAKKDCRERKTRAFDPRKDWCCPTHGFYIKARVRKTEDDRGNMKYGGTFFACPQYPKDCSFYASPLNASPTCSTGEDS